MTTVVDPVVDPAAPPSTSQTIRERLVPPRPVSDTGRWRRYRDRTSDEGFVLRDEIRNGRGWIRIRAIGAVLLMIFMFFFIIWYLEPAARAVLVPILESVFALPHNWFFRLLTGVIAAIATLHAVWRIGVTAARITPTSLSPWLGPTLLACLLASIPLQGNGHFIVRGAPVAQTIQRNAGEWPSHNPWHRWDLLPPPSSRVGPVAKDCPAGIETKSGDDCKGVFIVDGVEVTVTSVLSNVADGYTDFMYGDPAAPGLAHCPFKAWGVDMVALGSRHAVRARITPPTEDPKYCTFQPPKA